MPPNTVKVTRGPGMKWGNPFIVEREISWKTPEWAVKCFRSHLVTYGPASGYGLPTVREVVEELRGKNLACWCKLCPDHAAGKPIGIICKECAPCHADILLSLSNEP